MNLEDALVARAGGRLFVGLTILAWSIVLFAAGAMVGIHSAPRHGPTIVDVAGECR